VREAENCVPTAGRMPDTSAMRIEVSSGHRSIAM
jgi:hypothetical protein